VSAGNSEAWWTFLASLGLHFCKWSWGFGQNEWFLNAEKYRQIFMHHSIPSGRHLIDTKCILQHDNDPKRKSLRTIFSIKKNKESWKW
jgi:hypothetical protein